MAGKTNVSDYRFSIFINNDQAKRSLVEMEKVMIGYEANLQRLIVEKKKDTQEYRDAKKVYDDHIAQMDKLRKEAGLMSLSIKELRQLRTQLNNEIARAIPGSEHRLKLEKELGVVNKRLSDVTNGAKQTGLTFGKMADGFNRYFAVVTAGIAAISGLAFSIKEMITAQGELDDSLANIRKSTGMTAYEVNNLNKQLGKIDTRTSRQDLREMAVVAGQLGMAKGDVFAFVESVDKLNVALGDEFTGGAEQVAKEMGMLRNVLIDTKTASVADDMMRVGNAINTLGAAGFATGPVMADFASRIGGIGIPLGLTSDEVLGLSATLQELNVNAERGGTAVVKILQKMTTNTKSFAGIAGMPLKEFTNLVNTDLYGAFMKVIEGSKNGGSSATELAGIIKELEISGVGASEIFAKLGTNTEMLTEKVKLAGNSLQGTKSITDEFNIKNATLGAVLAKLQKDFYNLITLPGVTDFFKTQVYHIVQLVSWFKNLPEFIEKYKVTLIALTGATATWVAWKTKSLQLGLMNNIMLRDGIMKKIADNVQVRAQIVSEELLTIWKGKGTVATKLATTAQSALNSVMRANPVGLFITAFTAVVAILAAYQKRSSEVIALDKLKGSTTSLLAHANKALEESYSKVQEQMRKLSLMSMNEKKDLQDLIGLKIKAAEAELLLMKSKRDAIGQASAKPTGWQNLKASTEVGPAQKTALEYYSWKNKKDATEPYDDGIKSLEAKINDLKKEKDNIVSIINAESIGDKIVGKLAPQLEEKLRNYQMALSNYKSDSEEYIRINLKIKETNKELAKYNNSLPDSSGGPNKLKTAYEKLEDEIKKLDTLLNDQLLTHSKDAKATAEKLRLKKEQKQAIDDEKAALVALNSVQDDGNALLKKYNDELKQQLLTKNPMAAETSAKIQQIILYQKALDDLIKKLREKTEAEYGPIDKMQPKGMDSTYLSKPPEKLTTVANDDTQPGSMDGSTGGILGGGDEEPKWIRQAQNVINYANTVLSALSSIDQAMTAYENAQLQRDERVNNKKKDNLKKQLDSKKISQKQYDASILKMDEEMDAKKRELSIKQAKRQKALSLVQAIIGVAQGIVSAMANPGGIAGMVLAILVGLMGAVQVGLIASTPIPEAAKGRYGAIRKAVTKANQAAMGRYDVLGQDDKKQYRGVPFVQSPDSGVYDKPTLFAETGREIILNPKHTENLMRFRPDLVQAIMQVPQRAMGLYPDSVAQREAAAPAIIQFHPETLRAMKAWEESMSKPVQANISYDTMKYSQDTVADIERAASR